MRQTQSEISSPYNFDNSRIKVIITKWKQPDRVVLGCVVLLVSIWIFVPDQLVPTAGFLLDSLWDITPFLLISVLLAAYVKATGADRLIGAAFRVNANKAIWVAAMVGAFSPFCSCGVVPLIAALLASGVPLAPVMAFLMSSPVIDPEMALLTAGILGIEFALAKIFAALFLGLLGGYLVSLIQKTGGLKDFLSGPVKATCGTAAVTNHARPDWKFWQVKGRASAFIHESYASGRFLGKWLSLAFLIEGLMINNIPMQVVGDWLAGVGFWAIPASALVGVPAYMNGYAGIPMAEALMKTGLSAPAALSFMVAGGVTCIPAAIAVKALVKLPVFLTYLSIAIAGSICVGFLYAGYHWLL